jgi:hypothetical protein
MLKIIYFLSLERLNLNRLFSLIFFCFSASLTHLIQAQNIFFYDSLRVEINGEILKYPWAGGLNSAQPAKLDLEGKGLLDWVFFERTSGKFIIPRKPELEAKLPIARAWALWADLNADSNLDLMIDNQSGIAIYSLEQNNLVLKTNLVLSTLFSGTPTELQIDLTDYPAVWDIDGDGDLDFFNFVPSVGTTMEFHRNLWAETGKWAFKKETNFWGEFVECASCGDFYFGSAAGCRNEAQMHAGSTTTLLKMPLQNQPSMLISDMGCSDVYLMSGQKNQDNQMIFTDFQIFQADTAVEIMSMPSAFVFGDSLIFTPTLLSNEGNLSNFTSSCWLYVYENERYRLKSRNFIQKEMIDMGEMAQAGFFDADSDGDLDLIASNRGSLVGGVFSSSLYFFEKTSLGYRLKNPDWLNLSNLGFTSLRISFLDDKFVFAARALDQDRSGFYEVNKLQEFKKIQLPYEVLDQPHLVDVDEDGDADLLVAKFNGSLQLYENRNGILSLTNSSVCGLRADFQRLNLSVATSGSDLLLISNKGWLEIVRNFKDSLNTSTTPQTLMDHHFGRNNTIAVDGNLIFVGTAAGGFNCLKFTELNPSLHNSFAIRLYPNPTDDFFRVIAKGRFEVEVFDPLGKILLKISADSLTQIPVNNWPKGIYLVKVKAGSQISTLKVFVK